MQVRNMKKSKRKKNKRHWDSHAYMKGGRREIYPWEVDNHLFYGQMVGLIQHSRTRSGSGSLVPSHRCLLCFWDLIARLFSVRGLARLLRSCVYVWVVIHWPFNFFPHVKRSYIYIHKLFFRWSKRHRKISLLFFYFGKISDVLFFTGKQKYFVCICDLLTWGKK